MFGREHSGKVSKNFIGNFNFWGITLIQCDVTRSWSSRHKTTITIIIIVIIVIIIIIIITIIIIIIIIINIIGSGNMTEWSPIRSVIIRVKTKSDDRAAGVRFVYHEYYYRLNWTTRSPIIN